MLVLTTGATEVEWKFGAVFEHLGFLMAGVKITVQVSLLSMVIAIFLGLVVALIRMAPATALRAIASLYIDIFRSTPLLAQRNLQPQIDQAIVKYSATKYMKQ